MVGALLGSSMGVLLGTSEGRKVGTSKDGVFCRKVGLSLGVASSRAVDGCVAGCGCRTIDGCSSRAVDGCSSWVVDGCIAWMFGRVVILVVARSF